MIDSSSILFIYYFPDLMFIFRLYFVCVSARSLYLANTCELCSL